MKTKPFDCVEMMHKSAQRIYKTTKTMSRAAELSYWQARTQELLPCVKPSPHHPGTVREAGTAYRITR